MSNKVFANGMEIACKASSGKSVAAFPDVCFTPPQTPATPPGVPVPYPNTGMASDVTEGSKTVKLHGKEVMLKNKSYFKKSTGDEAGSAPLKGVLTKTNTGKVYFNAWSMDVKVEGENVVRHLDLTTHNHASAPGATPPWPFMASMATGPEGSDDPCEKDKKKEQQACRGKSDPCADTECQKAAKCKLVPYGGAGSPNCCPDQTGHHLIEAHWVEGVAGFGMAQPGSGHNAAPTVCAAGTRYTADHGHMHVIQGLIEESYMSHGVNAGQPFDYGAGRSAALTAHEATFGDSDCDRECLQAQLDNFYGDDMNRPLNPPSRQNIALTDPGDGRWTRSQAEQSLRTALFRR